MCVNVHVHVCVCAHVSDMCTMAHVEIRAQLLVVYTCPPTPPLFFEAGSLLFLLLGTCEFPGDSSSLPSISCGDAGITPFSVDAGDLTQVITVSDFTRRTISPARGMLFSTQISDTLTLPQLGTY